MTSTPPPVVDRSSLGAGSFPLSLTTPSSCWSSLPDDLLEQVAEYLTPDELGRSIRVCKEWARVINRNNFIWNKQAQSVRVINPAVQAWLTRDQSDVCNRFSPQILQKISEYGGEIENAKQTFANPHPPIAVGREEYIRWGIGDPGEAPPLPSNIHETLQEPCPFWLGKTIEETHTLFLISQTSTRIVEGHSVTAPLTLKILDRLLRSSNHGPDVGCRWGWGKILAEHGDTPVRESHWVLMTNDVVPDSRNKQYADQKRLVEEQGYEVPGILAAATAILLRRIRSGRRPFGTHPWTYTCCQEITGSQQLMVGGFNAAGLHVTCSDGNQLFLGVAGLRRCSNRSH